MTDLLQICPHDSMPFGGLCQHYHAAAGKLGLGITTVFLGPPASQPFDFAEYRGLSDLADVAALASAMQSYNDTHWRLILCHRYRSYKAVLARGLKGDAIVAIAHEYGMLDRWQRRVERALRGRHVHFAGVAPAVAAELSKTPLVLPNVLDTETAVRALRSRAEARKLLGLDPNQITVGVIGRLHYKKRPLLAVEAFKLFQKTHPDARLVFLGDGPMKSELMAELPGGDYLGNVPDAASLVTAFDVMLHTGNVDAFGMVVLEALFAGVPVVAPRGQGPEYILGELGHYPTDDTPEGFAQGLNQALTLDASQLLANGRRRVAAEFSIDRLAQRLTALLTP